MSAWRLIASAPKDGSTVLGWIPSLRHLSYHAERGSEMTDWEGPGRYLTIRWSGWGGGVWDCASSGHHLMSDDVTHWMPLPAPPERP